MPIFTVIVGYVAAVSMVLGYLPQTIRTIRTRSTDDIAWGTFLMMGFGSFCFAIQGYLLNNLPLLLTNLLTTTMSLIITVIKCQNEIRKRKNRR